MDQPIFARFAWTAEELLAGHRWHQRAQPFWRSRLLLLIGLGFAAFGIYQIVSAADYHDGLAAGVPMILAAFILFVLTKFLQPVIFRRQFAKRPDRNLEIAWEFSADEVRVRNPNGGSEFKWHALAKAAQTPEGFLLYPNPQIFHWVPRHAFDGDAEFQRLGEMVRSRVEKFRVVS